MPIDLTSRLTPLLQPRSVAVIGASARRENAAGNLVVRNLQQSRFEGDLHLVNPSGARIQGLTSVSSIGELPRVDTAVLTVPAASVLDSLRELEAIGCASAIVSSAGIDAGLADRLRGFSAESGMAVQGPNCMGLVNVTSGTPLWIGDGGLAGTPRGDIALVTQSGSAAIFVARSAWPAGFSKIVSTGNEFFLTTADYVDWLAADEDTGVIGLVVESIPDGPAFAAAVRHAHDGGKAVVALKVGRSATGAQATTAHTGALLSPTRSYDAYFEAIGVPLVRDYDELASSLQLLSRWRGRTPVRAGVGVLTISGGQAAITADLAEELPTALPALSDETSSALVALMPDVVPHNPFDGGGSVIAPPGTYERVLRVLADAPELGAVMIVVDAQSTLTDAEIEFEDVYVRAAGAIHDAGSRNPIAIVSSSSQDIHPRTLRLVDDRLPVIRGIRNALVALAAAATPPAAAAPARPLGLPSAPDLAQWRTRIGDGGLDAAATRELLDAYGIPFVQAVSVPDEDAARTAAERIGYPVVVKVESPDIAHRSDVGGVVLDIRTLDQLDAALASIRANVARQAPRARITGFEVQRQVPTDAVEAFAGFTADPRLGASVACGLGGTLVELLDDADAAHAPVSVDTARAHVDRTRLGAVLGGYRRLIAPTTSNSISELVSRLSWLADDLGDVLSEGDLNPVMITPGSGELTVVDALLVRRPAPGSRAR